MADNGFESTGSDRRKPGLTRRQLIRRGAGLILCIGGAEVAAGAVAALPVANRDRILNDYNAALEAYNTDLENYNRRLRVMNAHDFMSRFAMPDGSLNMAAAREALPEGYMRSTAPGTYRDTLPFWRVRGGVTLSQAGEVSQLPSNNFHSDPNYSLNGTSHTRTMQMSARGELAHATVRCYDNPTDGTLNTFGQQVAERGSIGTDEVVIMFEPLEESTRDTVNAVRRDGEVQLQMVVLNPAAYQPPVAPARPQGI